jgi:hypothetical protein
MLVVNRYLSFLLIVFILLALFPHASVAQAATDTRADRARETAAKIGTDGKSKVEVKLRDGRRLKGYLETISDDSVTLIQDGSKAPATISFSEIDELKRHRGGLGTGAIIGIVAAGTGAAILLGLLLKRCRNELGCGAGQ